MADDDDRCVFGERLDPAGRCADGAEDGAVDTCDGILVWFAYVDDDGVGLAGA